MNENIDPSDNKYLDTLSKNSYKDSVNSSNIPSFIILSMVAILMCILIGHILLAYPKYKLEDNRRVLEYYESV